MTLRFGEVCPGWSPAAWARELERKAERCYELYPQRANYFRRWAKEVARRNRLTDL